MAGGGGQGGSGGLDFGVDDESSGTQRRVLFFSHVMSTCARGFRRGFGQAKWGRDRAGGAEGGDAQTHGAPTSTAPGWYNNKHPVKCVYVKVNEKGC